MGNCISCREVSNEQPEIRVVDGNRKISDMQSTSSSGVGMLRSDAFSGSGQDGVVSVNTTNNASSRSAPGFSTGSTAEPAISSSSQKIEKKNFYSRIPPLGRSGSLSDRKSSSTATTPIAANIRDNNNQYSELKISSLFLNYKDVLEDAILPEGIERLCKDLDLKPDDFKVLVLAWKFEAKEMCRFARSEFVNGMKELRTDSLKGVQARLHDLAVELLSDPVKFKDLYRFTFKFGLDYDIGQRILPVDMAISLWRVVFSQNEPPVLDRWISFLEQHPNIIRGIQRDTWNMFLNFTETVGNDLSTYDEAEAWPVLFDEFVEFSNSKFEINQNISSTVFPESDTRGEGSTSLKTDKNDNSPKESQRQQSGKTSVQGEESYHYQ